MEREYPNRLRGGYYAPVISRAKSPMRPGKTAHDRAKRGQGQDSSRGRDRQPRAGQ